MRIKRGQGFVAAVELTISVSGLSGGGGGRGVGGRGAGHEWIERSRRRDCGRERGGIGGKGIEVRRRGVCWRLRGRTRRKGGRRSGRIACGGREELRERVRGDRGVGR